MTESISFGRCTIRVAQRELRVDGKPIELGGRAFDVLMALIAARGAVVSKDELVERVWPGRVIEDNTLQAQISTLRKALGPDRDRVRTVAGRGYHFAGETNALRPVDAVPRIAGNLPESVSELIGRDAELVEVAARTGTQRLVTLVGPGGIGKTRLGLEAARELRPRFAAGAWLVELAPISDSSLVATTVATALGLALAGGSPSAERVASALRDRQILVLLDNCEHLLDAAARMAEALVRSGPGICVIATSRESLGAEGEYVYPVPPLDVPDENSQVPEHLLRSGAVRLFSARARAAAPAFSADAHATLIGAICRRLDGIPLAIELAAARTASLGVEGVATRLRDRFRLLTGGYRTALPRQQTLRATMDWSYELLTDDTRVVLQHLSIFTGCFSLEAASAIAAVEPLSTADVLDHLAVLVAKSLVCADVDAQQARYRLLETTRVYAQEKLGESGQLRCTARRHAGYFRELMRRAEVAWAHEPPDDWLASYAHTLGDVRGALDWAFSAEGDAQLGVELTIATVTLWYQLALMDECRSRVEQALHYLREHSTACSDNGKRLYAALGGAVLYSRGPGADMQQAWTSTLEIAERLEDRDYQLRALWGLWVYHTATSEHRAALALAGRFVALAGNGALASDAIIGDRLMGVSLHLTGDQRGARRHIESMLRHGPASMRRSHTQRYQYDQMVAARSFLSAVLWLQGLPDQSMNLVRRVVDDALALNHGLSLLHALAQAGCCVSIYTGDLVAAERYVKLLLDNSEQHALDVWSALGRCYLGTLANKRGEHASAVPMLETALQQLAVARFAMFDTLFLGVLAEALAGVGRVDEGLTAIDTALTRAARTDEKWVVPELLRIEGELLQLQDLPAAVQAAESRFLGSLELASRQGALAWELRTAISLARLRQRRGNHGEARDGLQAVYGRFSEGFASADLVAARILIDSL